MALEALRYAWRAIPEGEYDSAIRPPLPLEELVELVRFRDLIAQMIRRDIVTR